ncbi:MAG: class I SAM-dependent methyltransferase [Bacillota bacterium]
MAYEEQIARIYDLYFPPDRSPEADLWARLAGKGSKRLLEPMIGTAEVACLLARRGYRVTGVDLSGPMLTEARRRLASLHPPVAARIDLIEGNICTAPLPEASFDLAYVGNGSWHLLTDRALRVAALRSVCRSLRPGGQLALDLFRPLTASGRSEPRTFAPLRPAPDGVTVAKTSQVERDHLTQRMQIEEQITVGDESFDHRLDLQLLTPEQVREELSEAGFTGIALYGDAELTPYGPDSPRLLVIADRA